MSSKRRFPRILSLLAAIVIAFLGYQLATSKDAPSLQITFLDVGQGDATFIRSPDGRTVLIDSGKSGSHIVSLLNDLGVVQLDLMIASHADFDHIGGQPDVALAFKPKAFIDNGLEHDTQTYQELLTNIKSVGSVVLEASRRSIALGDVYIELLPPPLLWDDQNGNSVGVIVRYGAFAALISGDATDREQDYWIENYPDAFANIDVYRSAHHGAGTGDMGMLLGVI
ncbi:MAG: MBL fold metallo-hydrolase, partial [Deinococcales bacterium]